MLEQERVRVLIAEDEYLVARMLQGMLAQRGYDVVGQASNGAEAIEMTASLEPDVVIMDIQMPDMDGLDASRQIQAQTPTPIVVLTAFEGSELVKSAAKVGVGAYLVKPPNARELERAITITRARFADLQELRRLNRELQLANQDLDAFSRMVAHDLKHFLGPVLLIAESLTEDDGFIDVKEAVHFLPRIAQAARDMDNVIEGLLLLAHMRRKNLVLVPLDMGALVQGSLRRLSHLINQRSATIRQPESWPTVLSFAQGVVEIWVNYLSNAVKYGGESPLIELGWQELTASEAVTAVGDESVIGTPNCVCQPAYRMSGEDLLIPPHRQPMGCFWVKDHGVGIAEVNIPALFEDAAREGALAPKREGLEGHGLGLPIVKHIVEKLGGSVYVRSEVGEGSTFAFTLPLSDEKPEA